MGKPVENPKRYIISCRINDDELQILQDLARSADTSISALLRHSLDLLQQNAGQGLQLSA